MAESRIEQLYDDIVNGNTSNIIPQSRNEAYLKAIRDGLADGSIGGGGSGGSVGTATITDEQVTAGMNSIFGEGNWSE